MTVSATARAALFAQQADEAFLALLMIEHDDLPASLRFVNNPQDVTSRGNVYLGFPFTIDLPPQDPDRPPRVRLLIDNIDRQIVAGLRTIATPLTITLEVVLASSPDTVEVGPFAMTLASAVYDALTIEGDLAYQDVLNEPFPGDSFSPGRFLALF